MTSKTPSLPVKHLLPGLCLTLLLLLSACSAPGVGSGNTTSTSTPGATNPPISVPTQIPTISSIPTVPALNSTQLLNTNLIFNGDAESGPGASDDTSIEPVPGWARQGSSDVIQYAATSGSYLAVSDPGPSNRGKNYFFGGEEDTSKFGDNTTTSLTQVIDLSPVATVLAQANLQFTLSAWLGGYSGQNDNAQLTIQFLSANGESLAKTSIGPVMAVERNNTNSLVQKSIDGKVPAGAAKISVVLTLTKTDGSDNDGSADNLSLVFHP
ncbi:MAG TPA: hypothetical protein VFN35_04625 [Ktedonobacteraceae bacterium]|nr:hypothetical protein [Ktedonobacteraceae bacterium]